MNDKRDHGRVGAHLLVELSHAKLGTLMLSSRDVSESGVFVMNGDEGGKLASLRVGEQIELTIHGGMRPLSGGIAAEVVRGGNGGLGLRFLDNPFSELE